MWGTDPTVLRTPRRRRDALLLAIGLLAAMTAALLPVFSVIQPGAWTAGAVVVVVAVLAAGMTARLFFLPAVVASIVEVLVAVGLLTLLFARSTSVAGVIPLPAAFATVPGLVDGAAREIREGVAPVVPELGLAFVLVASIGALAIVLDHVVLTARMPLLAGVGLVAVSLIPTIAIPADVNVLAFVLLAASLLFLLRVDTRARSHAAASAAGSTAPRRGTSAPRASATAIGIAVVAVLVAVVTTPLLPQPGLRLATGGIGGSGTTINPNLELGNDLRQPREVDVLNVQTTASTAPYLRAVTLSRFDGSVWQPDSGDTVDLSNDAPVFDRVGVDGDIEMVESTARISVDQLDSPWLPIPYAATTVTGLQGDWLGMPQNRTIVSRSGSTRDQEYRVTAVTPRPTLEQIRSRATGGDGVGDAVRALPADVPPIIAETAREVTAGAQSPYDRLIALQSWFRSSQFRYSLDAPVEAGFDGAGLDAVARFLQERSGYCVHFASAFAVMARTLDMPSRIVVGYLPGTPAGLATEGSTTYTVSSGQLHAWPEVYFQGVGWVPFEPTNSLGVPTNFASGSSSGSSTSTDTTPGQDASVAAPQPSAAPTTGAAADVDAGAPGIGSTAASTSVVPWLAVLLPLALLLALLAPATLRGMRRRSRYAAVEAGDPLIAWTMVREEALDLGIPVPAAESPRRFAARLVERHGVRVDEIDVLVAAVERASYAEQIPDATAGPALSAAVTAVVDDLRASVRAPRRALARALPRSLVVRPGSVAAEEREPVGR